MPKTLSLADAYCLRPKNVFRFILLFLLCIISVHISAQSVPANDNFRNAETIVIGNGGYGLGTFTSTKINLKKASKEAGESVSLLQYFAGTDKKTVWFVFETQTPRNVTIELRQKDTLIGQDGAGITIFRTKNKSQPPNLGEIDNSLTPISKFGSTGNTCLSPDKYYVQVSAKANANAEIWLNIVVGNSSPALYDQPKDAYETGYLKGSKTLNFDVGCQGIDSKNEFMAALGPDYNQTVWLTFRTDNYSDLIAFTFNVNQKFRGSDTVLMGYRLYKGDTKNAFGKLKLKDSAVFQQACNPNYPPHCGSSFIKRYLCELQSDTFYSIQLIFHKQAQYGFILYTDERGERLSHSANPKKLPDAYKAGMLKPGIGVSFKDYFACNSLMNDNLCGTVNVKSISDTPYFSNNVPQIDTFDLSLWSTFQVAKKGAIEISYNILRTDNYPDYARHVYRLFKGDVTSNCNLPLVIKHSNQGTGNFRVWLEPGIYSFQVMGTKMRQPLSNPTYQIDLGKEVNVTFRSNEEVAQRPAIHYLPSNPEDLGNITSKLLAGARAQADYFGMPDDTLKIDGSYYTNRLHFRQFYISKPTYLQITIELVPGHYTNYYNSLFSGRISKGVDSLKIVTDSVYGRSQFSYSNPFRSSCTPLPPGWYTVVSNFQADCNTDRKYATDFSISEFLPCKKKFNRPYKASYFGDVDWNKSPPSPGLTTLSYTFDEDCFGCLTDTPFSKHPIDVCKRPYSYQKPFTRVAYYVFNLKQVSALKIIPEAKDASGRSYGSSFYQLYKGDVRKDSLKFSGSDLLLAPCI
ncbi:MAG: hypothetical protein EOP53_01950 [Sphingobacteriales bacterium]|nr:MAG: hypothetical protein EOP53_01950 [Sphingobacteriales bacterium]